MSFYPGKDRDWLEAELMHAGNDRVNDQALAVIKLERIRQYASDALDAIELDAKSVAVRRLKRLIEIAS